MDLWLKYRYLAAIPSVTKHQPSTAQYHPLQRSKMVAESRTSRCKPNPECQGLSLDWRFTFQQSNDSKQAKAGVSSGSDFSQSSDLNPMNHLWRVMKMSVRSCGICKRPRARAGLWMQISGFHFIIARCLQRNKRKTKEDITGVFSAIYVSVNGTSRWAVNAVMSESGGALR